jgi:hypothetical protein
MLITQKAKAVGKNRRKSLLILLITVMTVIGLASFSKAQNSLERSYQAKLLALSEAVNAIPQEAQAPQNVKDDLDAYRNRMNKIIDVCKDLKGEAEKAKDKPKSEKTQSAITDTGKLCDDLVAVADYSKILNETNRQYLILSSMPLPEPSSEVFAAKAQEIGQILSQTKLSLQKIIYPRVDDPALPELITQVESAEILSKQLIESISVADTAKTTQFAAALSQQLAKNRTNFYTARNYFWNNTVQVGALRRTILELRDKF